MLVPFGCTYSYQKALLEMGGNDVEVLIEGRRIEEVFVARGSPREVRGIADFHYIPHRVFADVIFCAVMLVEQHMQSSE